MIAFAAAPGRRLTWRRRGLFAGAWDLVDADTLSDEAYATVTRQGFWTWQLELRTSDGRWHARSRGWLWSPWIVTDVEGGRELARYQPRWLGGVMRFADGPVFRWRRASLAAWRFESESGATPLRAWRRFSFAAPEGLELVEGAAEPERLPELALVAFALLHFRRHAH